MCTNAPRKACLAPFFWLCKRPSRGDICSPQVSPINHGISANQLCRKRHRRAGCVQFQASEVREVRILSAALCIAHDLGLRTPSSKRNIDWVIFGYLTGKTLGRGGGNEGGKGNWVGHVYHSAGRPYPALNPGNLGQNVLRGYVYAYDFFLFHTHTATERHQGIQL